MICNLLLTNPLQAILAHNKHWGSLQATDLVASASKSQAHSRLMGTPCDILSSFVFFLEGAVDMSPELKFCPRDI